MGADVWLTLGLKTGGRTGYRPTCYVGFVSQHHNILLRAGPGICYPGHELPSLNAVLLDPTLLMLSY